jgi:hypothetical protein
MPIRCWIEKEKNRVRAEVTGVFSLEEMLEAINGAVNDPLYKPGFDILSDHRKIERAVTTDQVKRTTKHLIGLSNALSGARWAAVVSKDVSYGMINMMSAYLKRVPMELRPFYTEEEAEEWLAERKDTT